MPLHYVIVDTVENRAGNIEGPATNREVKVHWPDGSVEVVSLSTRFKKVIEGSIEFMGLVDSKKCRALFGEKPHEFFSILLTHRAGDNWLTVQDICGDGKNESLSLRHRIVNALGQVIFDDKLAFRKAWDKAERALTAEIGAARIVKNKKSNRFVYCVDQPRQISDFGSVVQAAKPLDPLDLLSAQDLQGFLESSKDIIESNSLPWLFRATLSGVKPSEYKNEDLGVLLAEFDHLSNSIDTRFKMQQCCNFVIATAKRPGNSPLALFVDYSGLEVDSATLIASRKLFKRKVAVALTDSLYLDNPLLAPERFSKLSLDSSDELQLPNDLEYLSSLSVLGLLKDSTLDDVLCELVKFTATPKKLTVLPKRKLAALDEFARSLRGAMSNERISLLTNLRHAGVSDLASQSYFDGLSADLVMRPSKELKAILYSQKVLEVVARPALEKIFTNQTNRYTLAMVLGCDADLLEYLSRWGLSSKIQLSVTALWKSETEVAHLLRPAQLLDNLSQLQNSIVAAEATIRALRSELSRSQEVLEESKMELNRTRGQLQVATAANELRLASQVALAVANVAREFALLGRSMRREGNIVSFNQTLQTLAFRGSNAGVELVYNPGDEHEFDPETMEVEGKPLPTGSPVTILDPMQVLHIPGQTLPLTKALVRASMGTKIL